MSYVSVAEADVFLSHSAAWTALDRATKERHLMTAALWLNFSYEWPGCVASCGTDAGYNGLPFTLPFTLEEDTALGLTTPEWPRIDCCTGGEVYDSDGCALIGIPKPIRVAQATAALVNVTTPLFGSPATASDGGLTKKRVKVDVLEFEKTWSEPTTGAQGQLILSDVDGILYKIATRRGTQTGRPVLFM